MDRQLQAYLARIDFHSEASPGTLTFLTELHQAHLRSVPFENLDVQAGLPIQLEPDRLFDKLVVRRRGGYCFEQNGWLAQVLPALGYPLQTLAARVRRGTHGIRPTTHMLLRVTTDQGDFLVDGGFGGEGPSRPLPWREGSWEGARGVTHRLIREAELWVLQVQHDQGPWVDLYAFDERPHLPVDYVMYNHFTSTHPTSLFVNHLLVAIHRPDGYEVLFDRVWRTREAGLTVEKLVAPEKRAELLESRFGLKT